MGIQNFLEKSWLTNSIEEMKETKTSSRKINKIRSQLENKNFFTLQIFFSLYLQLIFAKSF